jgi:hypothetical protein
MLIMLYVEYFVDFKVKERRFSVSARLKIPDFVDPINLFVELALVLRINYEDHGQAAVIDDIDCLHLF